MGVLGAIVAQLVKLHLLEFVKDCQPPKRFTFVPSQFYNRCSTILLACVLTGPGSSSLQELRPNGEPPQKFGEYTKYSLLGTFSALSPQLNLVFAQSSCSSLVKISGRRLLVRLEKIHQTFGLRPRTGSLVFSDHTSIRMMVYANLAESLNVNMEALGPHEQP